MAKPKIATAIPTSKNLKPRHLFLKKALDSIKLRNLTPRLSGAPFLRVRLEPVVGGSFSFEGAFSYPLNELSCLGKNWPAHRIFL